MILLSMVLSDKSLKEEIARGRLVIRPLSPLCLQPASLDVHLGRKLLIFPKADLPDLIDVKGPTEEFAHPVDIPGEDPFIFQSHSFVLASTLEHIELPDDIVGRLEGRSSLGRLGLLINTTAGYIAPGWKGNLTLELVNVAPVPITLYYGMKIGQISFLRLTTPVDRLYGDEVLGSKYQGQSDPIPSRLHQDFL
jgi:dCTP deaminase